MNKKRQQWAPEDSQTWARSQALGIDHYWRQTNCLKEIPI